MVVPGEGPKPCDVLFLGEAPGFWEDKLGRPFVGRTGESMERYWGRGGVPLREDVFLTNVCKERPPNNRTPNAAEILQWLPSLCAEIEEVQPTLIVTLGATALSLFLPDLSVEATHAIPHCVPVHRITDPGLRAAAVRIAVHDPLYTDMTGPVMSHTCGPTCAITVFPMYHPAYALHDPTMQSLITYDFERLGQHLRGLLPIRHIDDDASGTYRRLKGREVRRQVDRWLSAGQ